MGFFKYDEKTDREWFEIELNRSGPFARACIQEYAGRAHRSPDEWVHDALVCFMRIADREDAMKHAPVKPKPKRVPLWRTKLADRLYGWADKIAGVRGS